MNQLILGDNLEILKSLESESIDLIYLDPPFFSNRNYEVIWGDAGEIRSFQDRWSGGVDHYIAWLKERVIEMHRLLKPTGSIFLHCDWHANAYIRVLILDKIFGANLFRNEIVWKRTTAHSNSKRLGRIYDTIFYYAKSEKHVVNPVVTDFSEKQLARYKQDDKGLYRAENLTSPGIQRQFEWRGVHPGKNRSWTYSIEQLENLFEQGLILLQKDGRPRKDGLKKYLQDTTGAALQDLWTDLVLAPTNGERIGYPTQKPEKLLERIVKLGSQENGVILDPFVGGGTTVAVADKLKRNWIGIDQSVQAIKVSEMRLQKHQDLFSKPFVVQLHKYDYDTLRYKDAFAFESWIIQQLGGTPNLKQRNDLGIDGRNKDGLAIQVKRSDTIGREVVDKFQSACKRFDNKLFEKQVAAHEPVGIIIAFSFGKGAIQEVARLKNEENTIIQLLKVEEIVPIAKKPKLSVIFNDLGLTDKGLREIEFTANAESEAGIEFFAWDFSYEQSEGFKADVLIDKIGKQSQTFKTGNHVIAVKVVDNEGLENLEVIELKVNGTIKIM